MASWVFMKAAESSLPQIRQVFGNEAWHGILGRGAVQPPCCCCGQKRIHALREEPEHDSAQDNRSGRGIDRG
jgi:hypothetical protein